MTEPHVNKQLGILRFIYDTVEERAFPPTVREIYSAVNLSSTSAIHGHLARLEKKGYTLRDTTKLRAIKVAEKRREALGIKPKGIPIVGVVTAGQPILAIQNIDEYFPLPPDLEDNTGELFVLHVYGEPMINAGILNGDHMIVRKQSSASNGEIMVAMTEDNKAAVKRFFKGDGYYRLRPESDTMDPIILLMVRILGRVVGLYRNNTD